MKYKIVLLITLLPVFGQAQQIPNLDSLVKSVIAELKESWTLGVDSNSNIVDIAIYNKYKRLFDSSAMVDDDLNFQYRPGKRSGTYKINAIRKDFDLYAHDVALEVTKLRIDSVRESNLNMNNPKAITVIIERSVFAEKPGKYVLRNVDALADSIIQFHPAIGFEKIKGKNIGNEKMKMTNGLKDKIKQYPDSVYQFSSTSTMRITMAVTTDSASPVKITRIENLSNSVTCINDADGDAILNQNDKNANEYGDFTANGIPDEDLDGIPDSTDKCGGTYGAAPNYGCPESYFITHRQIEGFIGLQHNSAKINLPELNNLGYVDANGEDAIDVLQSSKGSLKNPKPQLGIYGGGNFNYFFGKNAKQYGVSVGITYSSFVADYELIDPIVYTFKSNDGTDDYRRQITINSLKEQISYTIINIPVQFIYRFKSRAIADNKLSFLVKGGPSIMLFKNSSDYNTTIDFGGIYQIDTVSKNRITYYNFFDRNSTYNVFVTSSGINNQNTNPGAAAVFVQLANHSQSYDFAFNKNYRDKQDLSRTTIAFNFAIDGQYKGNKDNPAAVKFGLHCVYAPLPGRKDKYKPIDRTTDAFSSIYNSSAKANYFAYGVSIGFVYNF